MEEEKDNDEELDAERATSGGVVEVGEHLIKAWSKTQASITISSAEAELVAMCKLAAEMIGLGSLAADLGQDLKVLMYADCSAAIAIARTGLILSWYETYSNLFIFDRSNK